MVYSSAEPPSITLQKAMVENYMTNEIKLAELDRDEKLHRESIKLGDALVRLQQNKDFQLLIATGYLTTEAVRLVHAKADPALSSPELQAKVIRDIDAIGSLVSYLNLITINTETAKKSLAALDGMREYLLNEGD